MDTTQGNSASTINRFLKNDERESRSQNEAERPIQSPNHASPSTIQQEKPQLYPQTPSSFGYYPYYPLPLPNIPTMSYLYIDFLRQMSLESELRSYLPKFEGCFNESNSKECDRKTNNVRLKHIGPHNECNLLHCKDRAYSVRSRLCLSCEQRLHCSCCNKLLITERPCSLINKPSCNCCQCLISHNSLMHIQHCPVVSYNCACQMNKQIISKQTLKKKSSNKSNQTCLQTDQDNIPERDNTLPQVTKQEKKHIIKKSYHKNDSCESSSSDESFSQTESRGEDYESDYESEDDQMFELHMGEGGKHKTNKSEAKKKKRRPRQSLAYFINV